MDTVSTTSNGPAAFVRRFVGAAALDPSVYEEVENDRGATAQALAVVLIASVGAGFGAQGFGGGTAGVAFFSVLAMIAWASWALVTYEVGARILPEAQTRADVGELLRTTGFATAPGVLFALGALPGLTVAVFALVLVWQLVAMIVGVRQALDYSSTGRALAVCGVGWALAILFAIVIGLVFGPRVS
jgi:hypothetical protein